MDVNDMDSKVGCCDLFSCYDDNTYTSDRNGKF